MAYRRPRYTTSRAILLLLLLAIFGVLPGCRGGAGPEWPGPPLVVEGPPFVELTQLQGPAPLAGDRVQGGAGDWLLRNERLAVVVSGAENFEGGGRIIDAAPAGGRDRLLEIGLGGGPLFSYTRVFHDATADTAGRTLVMTCRIGAGLEVTTRMTLEAGSNAVRLVSTLTNPGPGAMSGVDACDGLRWVAEVPFIPGTAAGPGEGAVKAPFACTAGERTAYAWVDPDGQFTITGGGEMLRVSVAGSKLAAGESITFERFFLVTTGSWAEAADLAWALRGEAVGRVGVAAADPHHAPVGNAVIEARDEQGLLWAKGETSDLGATALPVPPGRYVLTATHPHRRARDEAKARVEAGEFVRKTFGLSDPGRLRLAAADEHGRALPALWTALDLETSSVGDGAAGGPTWREFVTGPTQEEVLLPPGQWRVWADHGPAHEAWREDVEVSENRPRDLRARLESLPLPVGWLAVDLSALAESLPLSPTECITDPEEVNLRKASAAGFDAVIGPLAQAGAGPPLVVPSIAFNSWRLELMSLSLDGDRRRFDSEWKRWTEVLSMEFPVVALANRIYVELPGADPDAEAVKGAVVGGRVQGTLGPFIEFSLEGAGLGDSVTVAAGPVHGRVRVVAPRDVDVREILIYVNDQVESVYRVRGDDPVRFDEEFELHMTEPGFVVVRVDGVPAPRPGKSGAAPAVLEGASERRSQALQPLAFTNPIRVAISGRRR